MRVIAIACLLGAFQPAIADKDPYDQWIGMLLGKEPGRAHRSLIRAGTPALEKLRAARDREKNEASRRRLDAIIAEIKKNEPFGLKFHCGMPKMRLTAALVNGKDFKYAVRVQNRSNDTVVLWPYLSLRVLDGTTGAALKPKSRRGRWGRRRGVPGEFLTKPKWVTLKPGERWDFMDGIRLYTHAADVITGFQVPGPGKYVLEFTYEFDRKGRKQRVDPNWAPLHDKTKPWNRALEMKHSFRAEMVVR